MSSVLLGCVTESHHSSRHCLPNMQKFTEGMLMQYKEKFQHYNSSFWFPCGPILIEEKCIYKTHPQILAFGPRHLISTDNLN